MSKHKLRRLGHIISFLAIVNVLFRLHATSDFGRDDLCGAAYNGDLFRMRVLLQAGADPSVVGWEEHFTPLGEAVRNGQVEAARMLLAWGADPNIPNDRGWGKTAATTRTGEHTVQQAQVIALIHRAGGR